MSNEATVRSYLRIKVGNVDYRSNSNEFRANVSDGKGPSPGAVTVSVTGTDIDFSELTTPALCRLTNQDATNFVEYGMWDGVDFLPLGEILPGESYVIRLSRNLGSTYGAGTGTTGSSKTFRVRADTAPCDVAVEAFDA